MLKHLGEQIRDCYRHAEDCAQKAAAHTEPELKRDFLDLERGWLLLAHSCEFSRRLNGFSAKAKRRTAPPQEVCYALHICRKDGQEQTEYNRRGELPKLEQIIPLTHNGEQLYVRVLNVITAPAKERAGFAYYVYAVEA
jgi:hypothetical protein